MTAMNLITLVILIAGGLNLASISFSDVDFVTAAFGESWLAKLAYAVIGFAALWQIPAFVRGIGASDAAAAAKAAKTA
jgi:uncharacterized membrane protein YuzA (DUF378 family)